MLGRGRPAYLELTNCRRFLVDDLPASLTAKAHHASRQLGAPLEVVDARLADKPAADAVNASAETKTKVYACVVWCDRDLTPNDVAACDRTDLAVFQKTPVRVMHSRSLATREKKVHRLSLRPLNKRFAVLTIVTSAGMYIKEFVHGDLGRTSPSLSSLLQANTDILQLDVLDVLDGDDDDGLEAVKGLTGASAAP